MNQPERALIEAESAHCEKFMIELFDISPEEEAEATKWVATKISGHDPGPFPASMQRIVHGHLPDEKMLMLCKKYRMKDTKFREQLLHNIYTAAIGGGLDDITRDHS